MEKPDSPNIRRQFSHLGDIPEALRKMVSKPPELTIIWMDPDEPAYEEAVSEPAREPVPILEPESVLESEPGAEPVPVPILEPEPEPAVEPDPRPETILEPEPGAEPVREPVATPRVVADPEPPITDAEFEEWVEEALSRVPEMFLEAIENVAFIVEHDPPGGRQNLLGLYHGVPLPGRGHYSGAMPDTITIYQNPLVRVYRTRERVKEEVYRTVVHEIGHYFGMDDDELHGLGW